MKLINHNKKKPAQNLVLIERSHSLWGMSGRAPIHRLKAYEAHPDDPTLDFRTSNFVVSNVMIAAGHTWLGYVQNETDPLDWNLAYWDSALRGIRAGPMLDGFTGGDHPKPVFITPNSEDNDGTAYVVDSDGTVRLYDPSTHITSIPLATDPADWQKRTTTEFKRQDPFSLKWGWGMDPATDTLYTDHDLEPWDGITFATYSTSLLADASPNDPPGFGWFWWGHLVAIWYHENRWRGLARGFVFDKGDQAASGTPLSMPSYAVSAVWQLASTADPTDPAQWNICMGPLSEDNADTLDGKYSGASTVYHSPFFSLQMLGEQPYFYGYPDAASEVGDYNETFIYTIESGAITDSLDFPGAGCYGGPLTSFGGTLYAPIANTISGMLEMWQLQDDGTWDKIGETAYTGEPRMATAGAYNGYIITILGQDRSVESDTISFGDTDETGWDGKAYHVATDTWTDIPRTFPPATPSSDDGIWPRMWAGHLSGALPGGSGGGGGGGGGGSGPCDDVYSAFGASTISRAIFASVLTSWGSPLLVENADPDFWYDILDGAGLNVSFALAQFHKESKFGTVTGQVGAGAHNVANIRYVSRPLQSGYVDTACCGRFATYASWEDGVTDYSQVLNLSIYAGKSISEIIAIYAPAIENDVSLYVSQVCQLMTDWDS